MNEVAEAQAEVIEEFAFFEDWMDRYQYLIDMVTSDVDHILVDSATDFEEMFAFAQTFLPGVEEMLELYRRRRPIFDLHGIEDEIKKALERSIPLKSGGYLIFDQTEAMTTIDINTGGYVGHRNLEETIYRTNLEAAVAIARQLRLRNLGGIIIIDFIDMLAGPHAPEEILASVDKGLYAPNFGGGQVDITSGKFVFSASEAYLIENGKITAPVKGAMLIGDGPEVLTKISMVGNDLELDSGVGTCGKEGQSVPVGVGQPSLKIDELTVGGTS